MSLLGKRYAKALLDISIKNGKIDEYKENLECLIKYFDDVLELKPFIENPKIGKSDKKAVIDKVFGSDWDGKFLNFIKVLIDKDRLNILSDILENYEILSNKHQNIVEIKVTSALLLDDDDIEAIKEKYKNSFKGFTIRVKNVVDKDIIGGLKLEFEDTVIDATLKTKLEGLKEYMLNDEFI